jgi:hypothetical protein
MKKSLRVTKRQDDTPRQECSLAIPPLAAAVARLADPMTNRVASQFTHAYALMPRLIAKMSEGDEDHLWTVLRDVNGLEAAERYAERQQRFERKLSAQNGRLEGMAYAVRVLEDQDPDLVTELATPLMDGSFLAGVAFACYVLLRGEGGTR